MAESICRSLRDGSLEGEHSPALTIKDTLQSHAGIHAFNYFLCSIAANVCAGKSQAKGLVLVSFSRSPSFYSSLLKRKGVDASLSVKCLRILDCYSDPLGWKEKIRQSGGPEKPTLMESDYVCRDVKDISKLLSSVLELGKCFAEGRASFAVAIDSISTMLRHASLQSVAGFISNLRSHGQVSSMLWLLQTDLHEPRSTAAFEYMSSIIASLEPMVQITDVQKVSENLFWQKGRFHVRFKRRNGRVKLVNEEFHIEESGITFTTPSENIVGSETLLPKLQFNLRLSEKERDDRSRVLLPFEHQAPLFESKYRAEHPQSRFNPALGRAPMADTNSSPSPPPVTRASASPKRDDLRPMGLKIAELNESQSELLTRLQGLKHDLQDWKSKLDTQVKTYKEELIELKKTLNCDLDQLKSDFQELRTTLQQQQDDISDSLRNLGLEDLSEPSKDPEVTDNVNLSDKKDPSLLEITRETSSVDASA